MKKKWLFACYEELGWFGFKIGAGHILQEFDGSTDDFWKKIKEIKSESKGDTRFTSISVIETEDK